MISLILVWLAIGLVSTILAIYAFRQNGTDKMMEMVGCAVGPFFGPVILVLLMIDIYREEAAKND